MVSGFIEQRSTDKKNRDFINAIKESEQKNSDMKRTNIKWFLNSSEYMQHVLESH